MHFSCPKCGKPLTREGHAFRCEKNHSYDCASEGYVNLLLANQKHSSHPGDDRQMVLARTQFLNAGFYDPLQQRIAKMIAGVLKKNGSILDAGCCEGFYTKKILEETRELNASVFGIDISKEAIKRASKNVKQISFAVASIHALPFSDHSLDAIVSIFAPTDEKEFLRVLKKGGFLLLALPSVRHLYGLKAGIYDVVRENPPARHAFSLKTVAHERISYEITLQGEQIEDLLKMTPYFWKSPKEGIERLLSNETLTTEIDFELFLLQT